VKTLSYIVFFISLFGVVWTYVVYPLLLMLHRPRQYSHNIPTLEDLPEVEIVFAAYNEATVIREKIESCFTSHYPAHKIRVHVGSDASNDGTDAILTELKQKYPRLVLTRFEARTGKTGIINALTRQSTAPLLLLTDANILFSPETIGTLVETLLAEKAQIVGGNIHYLHNASKIGISSQEKTYLSIENQLKTRESSLWKAAMGVEGGCYLIERSVFPSIPPTFFMEDFFVSMHVLAQGGKVLFNPRAAVYEDVSTQIQEEYKRKVRISIGNFQNLHFYKAAIFRRFWPLGFAFVSHKVLRWFTPFFLLLLLLSGLYLASFALWGYWFMLFYGAFVLLALLGVVFSRVEGLGFLKFPGHFLYMNLALLHGFFKYLKGINSNVWQPTKRNQV
jgi:cellulose synthase/poly-beta-1,6-N-acetylglucosamine synthase-like glycosyltransferase